MTDKSFYIRDLEIITPAGFGLAKNIDSLFQEKSCLVPNGANYLGMLTDESLNLLQALQSEKSLRNQDRVTLLALLLARTLRGRLLLEEDCGVIVGSSRGPTRSLEAAWQDFKDAHRLSPLTSPITTASGISAAIARDLSLRGPIAFITAACSTSLVATIQACASIKMGITDSCIVGGVEASSTPFTLSLLEAAKVLARCTDSDDFPCQPIGSGRSGMVLSEGGGLLVVDTKAGLTPMAEIIGWSINSEPSSMTGVSANGLGLQKAVLQALKIAGLEPGDIDLIVGHGSGTKKGDEAEEFAYKQIFETSTPRVYHKWLFGHMLGGSAVVSLSLGLQHLWEKKVPGHPYLPDDHPLRFWRKLARNRYMLVSSLGFGGIASCVIVKNSRHY